MVTADLDGRQYCTRGRFYREEEKGGWEVWNLNAGVNGESIGARRGVNGAGNRGCPHCGRLDDDEDDDDDRNRGFYVESRRFQLIIGI
jgi:hypothetical protein